MAIKHFLQFSDFTLDEYEYVIERSRLIKCKFKNYEPHHPLLDRTLVMVFEKNSTRTRLSFEAGMHQLGGAAIYLNTRDSQLGRGEPVEDAAQVMSRMCDIIMIRTFGQDIIERFAAHSRVPVINGLTNEHHPCQVLADVFTYIEQRGSIAGKTVAWIGDANNMLYSWLQAAQVFGLSGTQHAAVSARCRRLANGSGCMASLDYPVYEVSVRGAFIGQRHRSHRSSWVPSLPAGSCWQEWWKKSAVQPDSGRPSLPRRS
jgi:ornithine carbamoyltransferase